MKFTQTSQSFREFHTGRNTAIFDRRGREYEMKEVCLISQILLVDKTIDKTTQLQIDATFQRKWKDESEGRVMSSKSGTQILEGRIKSQRGFFPALKPNVFFLSGY